VRQSKIIEAGGTVEQETLGWNEARGETYSQRSKEDAHDYRYFPEPDLPPLVVENSWIEAIRKDLPELPRAKYLRFIKDYGLMEYDAARLIGEKEVADYFESAVKSLPSNIPAKTIANWMLGDLFSLMNQANRTVSQLKVRPEALADLVKIVFEGQINPSSAREVLNEMFTSGKSAVEIVEARGLKQVSDESLISNLVKETLAENPKEVQSYKSGKAGVVNFLFGQVMKKAAGKANPQMVRAELEKQLTVV
jgi:aspartyl-tRNA(Asn)/glutamyl-tRNA(Gln) amidotransferase subunit B